MFKKFTGLIYCLLLVLHAFSLRDREGSARGMGTRMFQAIGNLNHIEDGRHGSAVI